MKFFDGTNWKNPYPKYAVGPRPSAVASYEIEPTSGMGYQHVIVPETPAPGIITNHYVGPVEMGPTPEVDSLRNMLTKTGGSVVFNSHGYGSTRMWGPVIKNGVAMQEIQTSSRGTEVLGFFADGTTKKYYGNKGDRVADMVADGIQECFSFGCFLVEDGVPRDIDNDPVYSAFAPQSARQILGVTEEGVVMLTTLEGVSGTSGLGGTATSNFAKSLGYYDAIMLDGGGSAQTAINGYVTVPSSDEVERETVAYGELRVSVTDLGTGWTNLPYYSTNTYYSESRRFKAKKKDGVVRLFGTVKKASGVFTAGEWAIVATLPKTFLPGFENVAYQPALGPVGENVMVSLAYNGVIQVKPIADVSFIDFSNLRFDSRY